MEPGLPVLPCELPTARRGRTARDAELQIHRDARDGNYGVEPGIEMVLAREAASGYAGHDLSFFG